MQCGELEAAQQLAITRAEVSAMNAAKMRAAEAQAEGAATMVQKMYRSRGGRDTVEERRRMYWLKKYMQRGEWEEAQELVFTPTEQIALDEARRLAN